MRLKTSIFEKPNIFSLKERQGGALGWDAVDGLLTMTNKWNIAYIIGRKIYGIY